MEQIFKFFPNRSKKSVKCQWRRLNSTWNKILAEFKSKDRENYERLQELQQDIEISEESIDMSKVEFVDLEAGKETHEDNNDLPNQHLIEEDKQGEEGKQEDGGNQDNNDFPNQHKKKATKTITIYLINILLKKTSKEKKASRKMEATKKKIKGVMIK